MKKGVGYWVSGAGVFFPVTSTYNSIPKN